MGGLFILPFRLPLIIVMVPVVFMFGGCYPLLSTDLTIIPTITHDKPIFDNFLSGSPVFSTYLWISVYSNRDNTTLSSAESVVFLASILALGYLLSSKASQATKTNKLAISDTSRSATWRSFPTVEYGATISGVFVISCFILSY